MLASVGLLVSPLPLPLVLSQRFVETVTSLCLKMYRDALGSVCNAVKSYTGHLCPVQETVKSELCALNGDQFQLLADKLRDQMLNVCMYVCMYTSRTNATRF